MMTSFTDWLWSDEGEPRPKGVSALIAFSRQNKDTWPKQSENVGEIESHIRQLLPDDNGKAEALIGDLTRAWEQWNVVQAGKKESPQPQSDTTGLGVKLSANISKGFGDATRLVGELVGSLAGNAAALIAIGAVIAFLMVCYSAFLSDTGVLTKVSDVATARGAITFLFAFGTIILALMLVSSALFGSTANESEFNQRKERFNQGKEILTLLIGSNQKQVIHVISRSPAHQHDNSTVRARRRGE